MFGKFIAILGAMTIITTTLVAEDDLILGFRGKSKYQIVIPDKTANAAAEEAVKLSADLLKAAFAANNIDLQVNRESKMDKTKPGIYVGPTKFATENGVDINTLSGWTYIHKAVGKNIIIAGNDQPDRHIGVRKHTPKNKAYPRLATLFGAIEFAYRHMGARILSPSASLGVEYVPMSIIHVPNDLDMKKAPFRSEHEGGAAGGFWPTLYATAMCGARYHDVWSGGGHQHADAIPMKQCRKEHPEYFILANGLRASRHFCFSNPEVRELIYKHILKKCDEEGYEVVEVGQDDGFIPCRCEKCRTLYGIEPSTKKGIDSRRDPAWGEKIWTMHRDLAKRLLKDRPGKKMMLTAYGPTRHAPKTLKEFPPNVIVELMGPTAEKFQEWKRIDVPGGFAAYLYNWGTMQWVPWKTVPQIAEQNRLLVDNNVRIVHLESSPRFNLGLQGPTIYAYMRLGIDPNGKSGDQLFNEYIQAAFSGVETPMRRFFQCLQKRAALRPFLREWCKRVKAENDQTFLIGTIFTPDLLNAMEEDLAAAEKAASSPRVKKRLDSIRYEFDYLKHTAWVIHAYRNYQMMRDANSLNEALDAVDARNRYIHTIINGDDKYAKGKIPTAFGRAKQDWALKYYGKRRCLDRAPFNWDTAKVRANPTRLLKSRDQEVKAMKCVNTPKLASSSWNNVTAEKLIPVGNTVTNLKANTTFKILYDDKNLYVRVSGEQAADKMTFVKRGRDPELWLQESIVINVSPMADKSRYYYFAYEPEPTSFNDAQHGFITDSLHPLYGWNDENWNGEWSFDTRLSSQDGRWESMAVIPFKTLGVTPPKAGDMWFLNVGRVHFFNSEMKKKDRELSSWTGEINASRIPGDASFGKLTFE